MEEEEVKEGEVKEEEEKEEEEKEVKEEEMEEEEVEEDRGSWRTRREGRPEGSPRSERVVDSGNHGDRPPPTRQTYVGMYVRTARGETDILSLF